MTQAFNRLFNKENGFNNDDNEELFKCYSNLILINNFAGKIDKRLLLKKQMNTYYKT